MNQGPAGPACSCTETEAPRQGHRVRSHKNPTRLAQHGWPNSAESAGFNAVTHVACRGCRHLSRPGADFCCRLLYLPLWQGAAGRTRGGSRGQCRPGQQAGRPEQPRSVVVPGDGVPASDADWQLRSCTTTRAFSTTPTPHAVPPFGSPVSAPPSPLLARAVLRVTGCLTQAPFPRRRLPLSVPFETFPGPLRCHSAE